MKVLIIFAHPNEESFCAALREQLLAGLAVNSNQVKIHNLYSDKFNPVLSQEELKTEEALEKDSLAISYQRDIVWAQRIIIIHPSYWYGVPAILKGYFDRLLTEGFAYDYVIDHPEPKLQEKKGLLIQTFDAEETLEKNMFEDITRKSVLFTWQYCGVKNWQYFQMFQVNFTTNEQREKWLKKAYELGVNVEQ